MSPSPKLVVVVVSIVIFSFLTLSRASEKAFTASSALIRDFSSAVLSISALEISVIIASLSFFVIPQPERADTIIVAASNKTTFFFILHYSPFNLLAKIFISFAASTVTSVIVVPPISLAISLYTLFGDNSRIIVLAVLFSTIFSITKL